MLNRKILFGTVAVIAVAAGAFVYSSRSGGPVATADFE